jgi:hypothetical protein
MRYCLLVSCLHGFVHDPTPDCEDLTYYPIALTYMGYVVHPSFGAARTRVKEPTIMTRRCLSALLHTNACTQA